MSQVVPDPRRATCIAFVNEAGEKAMVYTVELINAGIDTTTKTRPEISRLTGIPVEHFRAPAPAASTLCAIRAEYEACGDCRFAYFTAACGNVNPVSNIREDNIVPSRDHIAHGKKLAEYALNARNRHRYHQRSDGG